jgi:hypothetical protein
VAQEPESTERFSLSRWSRRKRQVARGPGEPVAPPPASAEAPVPAPAAAAAIPAVNEAVAAPAAAASLPPVESLSFESDFSAFLQPKVEETLKRAALKKLFSDPRFNVMDRLDVYIDDYSLPDPMPEGMLDKLATVYGQLTEDPPEDAAPAERTPPLSDATVNADAAAADTAPSEHAAAPEAAPLADVPATPESPRDPGPTTAAVDRIA